ncbi:fimbrial assembly protein [Erwinia sp. OLTSP20]|uniref:outer membrane usher protein n=1 Tax=unclassified Erwinia TaxID=2622719 RepID=UPI000C186AC4|nr:MULTISPECIES: outer membrane usher protein [unclassified Erwinia]PIJ48163.1 fimbrial assembly protein [Erwinia sp. OAMSP11]PIJ67062.1 fimbrial assembly protein [Erwinia sp. OLSSP12]PIJ78369.1 fimbrial assembly protein [Erwinia sp. OLCASP19]PIJ79120.1 fimbrial assembly protein [Erwinia sp. OLMTSP26]PIJ79977.1 fimbrial assembly protein [Erwinia sp. OLMDSP33]
MKGYHPTPTSLLTGIVLVLLGRPVFAGGQIEFNSDVLDAADKESIDLSSFARAGYVMPGNYQMVIKVNDDKELAERNILFLAPDDDPNGSEPCIPASLVTQIGLRNPLLKEITYWHHDQCLNISSLKGMQAHGDIGSNTLYLSIPQAYLEYSGINWDPPGSWDNGIPGFLLDYNLNAQLTRPAAGNDSRSLSGNGTSGINVGPWRLRADWQGDYEATAGQPGSNSNFDWARYYAFRALPNMKADLMLGEAYLNSGFFDSFRYLGASLQSNDNMLPPNLRGYAPEVTGVAKTNARVTISQKDRVLYTTTVAAGPFRIQQLSPATSGTLEVKVEEQDGSVRTFQVNTASIPYLTRPGAVRYKMAIGQTMGNLHQIEGPKFASGEFSWGVNNGWSLYGGGLLGGSAYNSAAIGIGRDLMAMGALSFDITQSWARIPELHAGRSYHLSYSKRFDRYNSQITFAGYRFSQRNFMNMSQFLDKRYHNYNAGNSKELYSVTFSQQFSKLGLDGYLTYSHQTFWERPANDNYSLSLSRYFDIGHFKNISLSISAYRSYIDDRQDDGLYLSLNLPWGEKSSLTYDSQYSNHKVLNTLGYLTMLSNNDSYNLKAGADANGHAMGSAYYTHQGDIAQMTANASYQSEAYSSAGLSLQGGLTATLHGGALHRINIPGGTRMLIDTDGISNVPVRGFGAISHSNFFGKAVISDVNSYYRNTLSVDVNQLADNVDVNRSVVQDTLTEGAIGYGRFGLVAGEKAMAIIKMADGSPPPLGAIVSNLNHHQTGIVDEDGNVWLTGINPGAVMNVRWDGQTHCSVKLPSPLPEKVDNLALRCRALPTAGSQKTVSLIATIASRQAKVQQHA